MSPMAWQPTFSGMTLACPSKAARWVMKTLLKLVPILFLRTVQGLCGVPDAGEREEADLLLGLQWPDLPPELHVTGE